MFFKFEKKHDTDEMSQTKKKAVEHGYEIKRIYIIYIHFFFKCNTNLHAQNGMFV